MNIYNHTRKLFANNEVTLANLKVMLYAGTYLFNNVETSMVNCAANQVSGNGWTANGVAIGSVVVTTVNGNEARLSGNNLTVTASGGNIGPANGLVVFDTSGGTANSAWKPLFEYNFGSLKTADNGTDFKVTWNANGIHTWTN